MSLARFALRLCAVQALRGRTIVGDQVTDSRIGAIDLAADGSLRVAGSKPFADVYTDDSEATETGSRALLANGTVVFVVESAIATPMIRPDAETGVSVIVDGMAELPATDDVFELTLDILDREITTALTDPDNAWAELWRSLHDGIERVERRRVAREDDGVRRAARQVRMALSVKPDPVPGQPLAAGSVWARFKAKVDADLPEYSSRLARLLGEPTEDVTYEQMRARWGHTKGEARALGYDARVDAERGLVITTVDVDGGAYGGLTETFEIPVVIDAPDGALVTYGGDYIVDEEGRFIVIEGDS